MDYALSLCRRAGFWLVEQGRQDVPKENSLSRSPKAERTVWEIGTKVTGLLESRGHVEEPD